MFKSVRIQNFRQFRDLKLDNLAQINLITGMNSAGKTSLLEAVYLLDGPFDPSRTVTTAQFRGIGASPGNPELWDWLFYNRDTSRPIELSGKSTDGQKTDLRASPDLVAENLSQFVEWLEEASYLSDHEAEFRSIGGESLMSELSPKNLSP